MKVIILALLFLGVVTLSIGVFTAIGINNAGWEQKNNDK